MDREAEERREYYIEDNMENTCEHCDYWSECPCGCGVGICDQTKEWKDKDEGC